LRSYSNYLTPRKGFFSADSMTVLTTYTRNLALNLLILVLALSALLLLPRWLLFLFQAAPDVGEANLTWIAFACVASALMVVAYNLTEMGVAKPALDEAERDPFVRSLWVMLLVVLPVLASAWIVSVWLWNEPNLAFEKAPLWALRTGVGYALLWVLAALVAVVAGTFRATNDQRGAVAEQEKTNTNAFVQSVGRFKESYGLVQTRAMRPVVTIIAAFFSGLLAGPLILATGIMAQSWAQSPSQAVSPVTLAAIACPALVVITFALVAVLHIGLAGRAFSDAAREWWSRLGAYLLSANTLVFGLSVLALLGPFAWTELMNAWASSGLTLGWAATTLGGLILGRSAATDGDGKSAGWQRYWMMLAPYVFIVGLLLAVATAIQAWLPYVFTTLNRELEIFITQENVLLQSEQRYWYEYGQTLGHSVLAVAVACALLSMVLSYRIGINDFSIHAFYRNRLVRAYLGASNGRRAPQPFTGFDFRDDIKMASLVRARQYDGPYPIVNTALNLVHGTRLAWQTRKATSFIFTPRYFGYDYVQDDQPRLSPSLRDRAFRPVGACGEPTTLGTALAISGAAASPNMGYHSSMPLAFLMTVFNVRLGWWLGNPRHEKSWWHESPKLGVYYLLCELFGFTDDRRRYVYLSDGGHFENLGIYELVRRRCRVIICCDAGEDHASTFGDLGLALEKIRSDFGIPVDIDVEAIKPRGDGRTSQRHFAVGTIHYDRIDKDAPNGVLLYIKSSVTDDVPTAVKAYRATHKEFPHQSTADQWFDESQFETYRALGEHAIATAFPSGTTGRTALSRYLTKPR
jgi:hypothetical protein